MNFLIRFPYKLFFCAPTVAFAIGYFLNSLVMWVNKNAMPVYFPAYACPTIQGNYLIDRVHSCMTPDTHLKFLADIWHLPRGIASLGDFFIYFWDWTFWPMLTIWAVLTIKKVISNDSH